MRDLLRLLGIAILVFLLVGFAMIYSRDSGFRYGVSSFLSGTGGAISRGFADLVGSGGGAGEQLEMASLRITRPDQSRWVGLAGFPDQTEVHFPMPRLGGHVEGRFDLLFDVQLAQGGDGLLTINVNGERRSEIVLNTGNNGYEVSIPLQPSDFLGERIVLGLAARGTTNSGQICPTDAANSGSAISLLPESALVLNTLQAASEPETALIATPEPLRIYLGDDRRAQTAAVWAAQHMARAGVLSEFVDDPLMPGKIIVTDLQGAPVGLDLGGNIILNGAAGVNRAIDFHRADAMAPATVSGWPIGAGQLTTETMARNFRGSKRWVLPYKIADLPGGLTPTRLDLALRTSLLAADYEWVVRVSLNGNLLETSRLPGNVPDIRLSIDMPTNLQGLNNSLLVELVDTSPNQSICRAAPDAQAQLLPETVLALSGPQPQSGWGALVRKLSQAEAIAPGNRGLVNIDQARRAAAMLMQFLPADGNVAFAPDGLPMTIAVLDKAAMGSFLETFDKDRSGQTWYINAVSGNPVNPLGLYDLASVDTEALLAAMHPSAVVIIVQSPATP